MEKILIILTSLFSLLLLRPMDQLIRTVSFDFANRFDSALTIAFNDQEPIVIQGKTNQTAVLNSVDQQFIKKLTINGEEYNHRNIVLNEWNHRLAQAVSSGPESGYTHYQKPLFSIDCLNVQFLKRANEVVEKGKKSSIKEGIIIKDATNNENRELVLSSRAIFAI